MYFHYLAGASAVSVYLAASVSDYAELWFLRLLEKFDIIGMDLRETGLSDPIVYDNMFMKPDAYEGPTMAALVRYQVDGKVLETGRVLPN